MKRLFFPLFAGLLWLMSGTLSATERTYNVLFIQSYTKNTPWHSLLTENLENGLDKGGVKANITTEYLNADYWSFASECFIMRRICERARQRKTDLIVTSSDEAFFTLTHCGDSLPYQIPVVFRASNTRMRGSLKECPTSLAMFRKRISMSCWMRLSVCSLPAGSWFVCPTAVS